MSPLNFPILSNWQSTKATLHAYSRVIAAIPRTHLEPHPKWWHVSLKVQENGLTTDPIPTPLGDTIQIEMDLRAHRIVLSDNHENEHFFDMTLAQTADELAQRIFRATKKYELTDTYDTAKFSNSDAREYVPAKAELFLEVLQSIHQVLNTHRSSLSGEVSPVQLWPHNFDMSFEWFGTRMVEHESNGEIKRYPSQLNCGWTPGGKNPAYPYFYSNPYPFEPEMAEQDLPSGAIWFQDGWNGSILPYENIAESNNGAEKILAYTRRVFEIVSPRLR